MDAITKTIGAIRLRLATSIAACLAGVLVLVAALAGLAPTAEAGLEDGRFCVAAKHADWKQKGERGYGVMNCGAESTPLPPADPFRIEGSTDGVSFTADPSKTTHAPDLRQMEPGESRFSRFIVRTGADSSDSAVQIVAPTGNAGSGLTYSVRALTNGGATDCRAAFADNRGALVVSNAALDRGSTTLQGLAPKGGSSVTYCFSVNRSFSAGTGEISSTASWDFTAVR